MTAMQIRQEVWQEQQAANIEVIMDVDGVCYIDVAGNVVAYVRELEGLMNLKLAWRIVSNKQAKLFAQSSNYQGKTRTIEIKIKKS